MAKHGMASTIFARWSWCSPTAGSRANEKENRDCSGPCAAGAATSASPRRSSSLHAVGPLVSGGLCAWPIRSRGPRRAPLLSGTPPRVAARRVMVCALLTAPGRNGTKLVGHRGRSLGSLSDAEAALGQSSSSERRCWTRRARFRTRTAQRHARRRISEGRAELLEVAVPRQAERWRDLDAASLAMRKRPSPMCRFVEHSHGAATRVPTDATACHVPLRRLQCAAAGRVDGSAATGRVYRGGARDFT